MKAALYVFTVVAAVGATSALAAEDEHGRRASPAEKPSWEFAITAYPTWFNPGGIDQVFTGMISATF